MELNIPKPSIERRFGNMLKIDEDGCRRWHNEKDELHRDIGPAVEYSSGAKFWFINNKLHREDGPAVDGSDGSKEWWINDQLHRIDGPAVDWIGGNKEWWLDGIRYSEKEYREKVKKYVRD